MDAVCSGSHDQTRLYPVPKRPGSCGSLAVQLLPTHLSSFPHRTDRSSESRCSCICVGEAILIFLIPIHLYLKMLYSSENRIHRSRSNQIKKIQERVYYLIFIAYSRHWSNVNVLVLAFIIR